MIVNHIIYKLVFPNNKIYVGQTNNFKRRLNNHKNLPRNYCNRYLFNAIRKYGWENIKKEILLECNEKLADFVECSFIDEYNSTNKDFGYNLDSGGNKNKSHSKETIEKLKQYTPFKNKKHSGETKKKMSDCAKGRKFSKETLQKMRNAKLGRNLNTKHKENISNSLIGHKVLNKTRKKISESKIGNKNPMYGKKPWNYGKHLSEETKKKISETKLKNRKK